MAFDFASMNPFAPKASAAPAKTVAPVVPPKPDNATLPNDAGKADAAADPLAPFAKMYDTSKTPDAPPQFALDGAALETAAKSLNFMQGVDPALMAKAQSGDSAALLQLIEHTGRMAYQSALSHSSTLTGKFTEAREAFNNKDFSGRVKNELTVNAMTGMANFNHPVVRKELIKVAKDMQSQHPDASPQEVAEMAKTYITELSRAVNPTSPADSPKNAPQNTDWDNFFDQN